MDIRLLRIFQKQVLLQCQFVLHAADDLNAAMKQSDIPSTFFAIQNLLNAAADISKAFWGEGGRLATERKPLRDSIGVSDSSPFRQVVMRNNFEHFDERLDRWWRKSKRHNYADLNVMSQNTFRGLDDIDMFRMFDPNTTEVIFWSQRFNIREIVSEVQRILPQLTQEASKPHWPLPSE